ncbi:MAG: IPT/TIG domain-containing protein [Deltaproteobacteria bacterium]|nr:IPT/TIG domain-containing protein [Deltaproteobacteria bacterium]
MRTKLLLTGLTAAVAACGGDNTTCGTGTMKMGDMCVATGGGGGSNGSGTDLTCGTGTHQMGNICVPDDTTVATAPTITMMAPAAAGISGGGLFTITGTGFNGSNVTDLHVFFGDPTNMNCEATLGAASATEVSGQVPSGCTLSPSVTVTLQTNLGTATTPFTYIMMFAGDGLGGGIVFDPNQSYQAGGSLYVIDPVNGRYFTSGTFRDANNALYSYGGMDFDATGKLIVATTGFATSDADQTSQLLSIDLTAGLTVVGDITDASGNAYYVSDLKFLNGTLYAWASYDRDGTGPGTAFGSGLVSINPTTGAVTKIGSATVTTTAFFGGLATDGTTLYVAPSGASSDSNLGVTGEYDSVNVTTGALTNVVTLDWYNPAPVQAMTTFFGGTSPLILAVMDNGTYGPAAPDGTLWANETLAAIDPAADTANGQYYTNEMFEMPGPTGFAPHIDAIAIPPSNLVLQRTVSRSAWKDLKKANGRALVH